MKFQVRKNAQGSFARVGKLTTSRGVIETPVFMPVATVGAVKTLSPWELEELGASILLGNTYHLHLRPGEDVIAEAGGLQRWMSWGGPILTDSGGYQAFSLGATKGKLAKTTDEGVRFYSHLDGDRLFFTPESVIDIQLRLGSDIVMVLDDCAPYPASKKRLQAAVKRTTAWAKRSVNHWDKATGKVLPGALRTTSGHGSLLTSKESEEEHESRASAGTRGVVPGEDLSPSAKGLFGIVQGGLDGALRRQSMQEIQALPFDGIAIGGVSVGEGKQNMLAAVDYIAPGLDPLRPHYLMGVGEPLDLIRMIDRGMDMFDCVLPTRLARHGSFWTTDFQRRSITNAKYARDGKGLDEKCRCRVCQTFSRRYIRHLYISGESLAGRLLSYHNLWFIFNLLTEIRQSIVVGDFKKKFAKHLKD